MTMTMEEMNLEIKNCLSFYRRIIPAHQFDFLMNIKSKNPGYQGAAIQMAIKSIDFLLQGKMIFLSGPVGVGKTIAAFVLAIGWSRSRKYQNTFLFCTSRDILKNEFEREKIDYEKSPRLVIIDDLGREFINESNPWGIDLFEAFVDRSYSHNLPRIFTTNLTPPEIRERYGARLYDRMRESARWLTIPGESLRGKESKNEP